MEYNLGDIVFLHNKSFKYPNGSDGDMHPFVIVAVDKGEYEMFPANYSAFLVSSEEKQENREYNEKLKADKINRLLDDSHVKCDFLYKNIKNEDIFYKLGEVTKEQFFSFIELYVMAKAKDKLQK